MKKELREENEAKRRKKIQRDFNVDRFPSIQASWLTALNV
jgi:hypothetical protein